MSGRRKLKIENCRSNILIKIDPTPILDRIQMKYNYVNIWYLNKETCILQLGVLIRFDYSDRAYDLNTLFSLIISGRVFK